MKIHHAPRFHVRYCQNALREATKHLAERYDATFQWIRAYYIVGDDVHGNSIFSKLYPGCSRGKDKFPFTTGKNKYDFIDVDELARQIAATVGQNKINGVINCCTGQPMSLADRVEQYIHDNNLSIILDYGAFPDRPYDSPGVWEMPLKFMTFLGHKA